MKWLDRWFHKRKREAQIDSELRFHIEQGTAELIAQGVEPGEARRRAMVKLGGVEAIKQEWRESRASYFLGSVFQDVRYAFRMLRKSPGFTAVAIVTLAMGIGANTAIFSAVNGILLQPLPYLDSARLVEIRGTRLLGSGFRADGFSIQDVPDIQARCSALGQVAAYGLYGGGKMLGGSFPDDVQALPVAGNFFSLLGVRPLLGRPILSSDTQAGAGRVVVLRHSLWKHDFGGDPKVVGKIITLDRKAFEIVGVMPKDFTVGTNPSALWLPMQGSSVAARRAFDSYSAVARLRPGVTLKDANAQLKAIASRLASAHPEMDKGLQLGAESLKDEVVGSQFRTELLILLAAVGLVLLIACVNVSGMLLARSFARNREVAIRGALGATRWRVVRQFLVESMVLSLVGGALGLLLAVWAIPALRAIAPPYTPHLGGLRLDENVLWFTLAVSVLAGVVFGLGPALQASGAGVGVALKEGFGGLLDGPSARGPRRLHGALVIVEIALAVILGVGATLLARSLQHLLGVKLGYRAEHVLTVQPDLSGSGCDFQHQAVCRAATADILQRVRGISGVEAAAVASTAPLSGGFRAVPELNGPAGPKSLGAMVWFRRVSTGYFSVMDIPLLAGRDFSDADTAASQPVAIVNRAFAQRYLASANPLGHRISMRKDKKGKPKWMEIVGEVGDGRDWDIAKAPEPEFYLPDTQSDADVTAPAFLVRASASPLPLVAAVKQQIWSVEKEAVIGDVKTMDEIVAEGQAGPRFRALLLGAFGVLGVLLAIVGTYGVSSYAVSLRTREIGLRMALGARPFDALWMVIREGMVLAGVGVGIGLCGALALTRLLRSFLFEIRPDDPATLAGVAVLLTLASLAACYVPARRAMRVDPNVALRRE